MEFLRCFFLWPEYMAFSSAIYYIASIAIVVATGFLVNEIVQEKELQIKQNFLDSNGINNQLPKKKIFACSAYKSHLNAISIM